MKFVARPVTRGIVAWLVCQSSAAISYSQNVGESQSVVFDNISANVGLDSAGASPASQIDSAFPFEAGAADDFVLAASPQCRWEITGVQWTGKYWGDAGPGSISGFRIVFWADVDGIPRSGTAAIPDVQQAIATYNVAGSAGELPSQGGMPGAFDYEAFLPQPLEMMPGVRYWIQIQAIAPYPPQWGLHITPNRQGLGPVQYFDLLSLPAWAPVPDEGDLAFRIFGSPLAASCDDGNACTADACVNGSCVWAPMVCDDGNACTMDSCHPLEGCVYSPLDCQDNNQCTTDSCSGGICDHRGPPDFDGDGDVDLSDLDALSNCVEGAFRGTMDVCGCTDLNGDGYTDLRDVAEFQASYTGSK